MDDRRVRRDLAERVLRRVLSGLDDVLGDRFARAPGTKPGDVYDHGLVVGPRDILVRCPRSAAAPQGGDFRWTAATARRQIGLRALTLLGDDAAAVSSPSDAVHLAVANREGLSVRLAEWLDTLGSAGLSTVVAAAVTWTDGVERMISDAGAVRWAGATAGAKWDHPGHLLRVTASHDASFGGPVSGEALLLVADQDVDTGDRARAAHLALVWSLLSGRAPRRVTLAAPSRGTLSRVPVDEELLMLAADRLIDHVALRCEPAVSPARPGRECRYCRLLDSCEEGLTHQNG